MSTGQMQLASALGGLKERGHTLLLHAPREKTTI